MTVEEIDARLRSIDSEEVKNGWTILDTNGEQTYGLNYAKVAEVAREMESDACLADELYATSNHDLKVFATCIDDPDSYTKDELNKRGEQLYPSPFADKFCHQVIAKSQHAVHFIDEWSRSEDPEYRYYAYLILDELAKRKNNLSCEFFSRHVKEIAETIHNESDEVKEAMHQALISIGCRERSLKNESVKAAQQIGQVAFENGEKINTFLNLEKKLHGRKFAR
jgi:3-methyladenine DNA glycosylase AlkD